MKDVEQWTPEGSERHQSRLGRQDWLAIAFVVALALLFLPIVVWKTVWLGQGDVQVIFRAGWAIWTGYPLYQVTDHHGWTYHYPPTLALFMGPFADPLPGYTRPFWAFPYTAAVVVWYGLNVLCLFLSSHLWASALERYRPIAGAQQGFLHGPWLLRLGPFLALLPFVGVTLVRGQLEAFLLLLVVSFVILYVENRVISSSFVFALATAIKVFPIAFAIFPLLRRDGKFLLWAAGWCVLLLIGLPAICLGPEATLDLYRDMWTEHLAGMLSGSMSTRVASEVSPGAYANVSVGSVLARIAAGKAFFQSSLPFWATAIQYLFDTAVVAAVTILGRGGFWNLRERQPARGYPLLIAGAVLLAAMPLMLQTAKPNYITLAMPLMAVFMVEAWQRVGQQVVTRSMIGWIVIAWISVLLVELRWDWVRVVGPVTWALLILGPASLLLIREVSIEPTAAAAQMRRSSLQVPGE